MRILLCTGIYPPEVGGPATYTATLAGELIKRGHEVRVITYSNAPLPPLNLRGGEGELLITRITRSRFKPWHYYKYFRAVKKFGKETDVLYAQGPVSDGYPTYLASKVLKKPLVVKITGDYSWEQARGRGLTDKPIDEFQDLKDYPKAIRKMRQIQKIVCQAADLIITPSRYLKKIVEGWGIDGAKIRVIYNALPPLPLPLIKEEKERGLEFLIVSAGRDVPWKGFDLLKQVISELSNSMELDTARFRLEILQGLSREELFRKLKSADLFVLNTGYEGFPHSVLEAMAAGVPVVTTKVGGNPEMVEHGKNGLLVEYNNKEQLKRAIWQLYQDENLRWQLAENAQKTVQRFSLENMINQTEQCFKALVK